MKRFLMFAAALMIFASASNASASAAYASNATSRDEMVRAILSICSQNAEYSAPFTEERAMPRKEKVNLKGTLTYRDSDYLLMEYTVDTEKFLIDGNKMINRREGKTMNYDLTKNLPMRDLSNTLLYSFSGQLEKLSEEQNTSLQVRDAGDSYEVVLDALKKQARGYNHIEIVYRKKDGRILRMKMDEFNGASTIYCLAK